MTTKTDLPPEEGLALLRRAAEEEETLSDVILEGLVLSGEDLSGLELRDVTFRRCRFPGCGWGGRLLHRRGFPQLRPLRWKF